MPDDVPQQPSQPDAPAPLTAPDVIRRLGPAGPLALIAAFMPAVGGIVLLVKIETVGLWLRSHGDMAVVIYSAAFMALAGLALLPTYAQAILGGWAFGLEAGFPAAMLGFIGGAMIGYEIAKGASGDRVEKIIEERPKWRAVRDALVGRGFWPTLGIVTLVRVPPNSPFAITNLVMASVQVPRLPFIIGTAIGMAPRTAAVVWIASLARGATAKDAATQRPGWYLPVAIGSTVVVVLIIWWIAHRALARAVRPAGSPGPIGG